MKKLVLAISLVIASAVNVFGQDTYLLWDAERKFLESYDIDINSLKFSDSIISLKTFLKDKISNCNEENSFNDLQSELSSLKNQKVVGFESIYITKYPKNIKKIEILKLAQINGGIDGCYTIYLVFQDLRGFWHSTLMLMHNNI